MNKKVDICHFGANEWFDYKLDLFGPLYQGISDFCDTSFRINNVEGKNHQLIVGIDVLVRHPEAAEKLVALAKSKRMSYSIFNVENINEHAINGRVDYNKNVLIDLVEKADFTISIFEESSRFMKTINPNGFLFHWVPSLFIPKSIFRRPDRIRTVYFNGLLKGDRKRDIDDLSKRLGLEIRIVDRTHPFAERLVLENSGMPAISLESYGHGGAVNPFRFASAFRNQRLILYNHTHDPDSYIFSGVHFDQISSKTMLLAQMQKEYDMNRQEDIMRYHQKFMSQIKMVVDLMS